MQIANAVGALIARELVSLQRELEAYPHESQIWAKPPGVPNAAGTLALHLAGNLQHFLGAVLGATGYERNRPAEFERRDVSRAELLAELDRAISAVRETTMHLREDVLMLEYPEPVGGVRVQTGEYLVHLLSHCAYHLGQVDYHRRVVTGQDVGVGALKPSEIPTARPA